MKILTDIVLLITVILSFLGVDGFVQTPLVCDATVETWEAPAEYGRNETYTVEVSEDGENWVETAVYNVKIGNQPGDPINKKIDIFYNDEPYTASLVTFDFTGTVGIRVTYNGGALFPGRYVISPESYSIKSTQKGNTVTFTVTQDESSPRKIVFRPQGEWNTETLHILTNVPEKTDKHSRTDENVYVVEPDSNIPLYLPQGKDTYYFKKGIHTLPKGYWADIDLGETKTVKSFDLLTPDLQPWVLSGGLCFEIQAKNSIDENFKTVYKSTGEAAANNFNLLKIPLQVTARYFRLILLGSYNPNPQGENISVNAANIKEFTLYDADSNNLSLGCAVDGASADYALVTDGLNDSLYGHPYAGESFNVNSSYTYYLEKGAVVKGSFVAENCEDVTVCGRGIIDGCELESAYEYAEGRNSAIRFEHCKNVVVEGITVVNSSMWSVIANYSENVLVSGINVFGYTTNSDGIHFSASENAKATGCFVRSPDDIFVAYHYGDTNNLIFENSVLWSDGGKIMLLGLADSGDISNVTMQNCDVITYQNVGHVYDLGGFVQINATGNRTISDVLIKDIRIDKVRSAQAAQFLHIRADNDTYGSGFIKNITLENISHKSSCKVKSRISVSVPGGMIEGITLKNVSVSNKTITSDNVSKYFDIDSGISIDF